MTMPVFKLHEVVITMPTFGMFDSRHGEGMRERVFEIIKGEIESGADYAELPEVKLAVDGFPYNLTSDQQGNPVVVPAPDGSVYLGDDVYIKKLDDGSQAILFNSPDPETVEHAVYLSAEVMDNLKKYLALVGD